MPDQRPYHEDDRLLLNYARMQQDCTRQIVRITPDLLPTYHILRKPPGSVLEIDIHGLKFASPQERLVVFAAARKEIATKEHLYGLLTIAQVSARMTDKRTPQEIVIFCLESRHGLYVSGCPILLEGLGFEMEETPFIRTTYAQSNCFRFWPD